MTTFVKEQSGKSGFAMKFTNCEKYAKFLESNLEFKMFVVCDEFGNPVSEKRCDRKLFKECDKPWFKNITIHFSENGLGYIQFKGKTIWNVGTGEFWFNNVEGLLSIGVELTEYGVEQLKLSK